MFKRTHNLYLLVFYLFFVVILATNGSGKIEFILITLFTSIGYIYVNIPEARKKINRFL